MKQLRQELTLFALALQLLTRVPIGQWADYSDDRAAASSRYYPLIGALIGVVGAVIFWVADAAFPQIVAVLIALIATALITGALHEDGFADCCDGLGGGATRERALEIMRDSRLGTYGVLGLMLMIALKLTVLTSVASAILPWCLVAGHCVSRAAMVVVIGTGTYARSSGSASGVASAPRRANILIAVALALLALVPLALHVSLGSALASIAGATVLGLAMHQTYQRRLGGYTGDCLGAIQQVTEVGVYLGMLASLS